MSEFLSKGKREDARDPDAPEPRQRASAHSANSPEYNDGMTQPEAAANSPVLTGGLALVFPNEWVVKNLKQRVNPINLRRNISNQRKANKRVDPRNPRRRVLNLKNASSDPDLIRAEHHALLLSRIRNYIFLLDEYAKLVAGCKQMEHEMSEGCKVPKQGKISLMNLILTKLISRVESSLYLSSDERASLLERDMKGLEKLRIHIDTRRKLRDFLRGCIAIEEICS